MITHGFNINRRALNRYKPSKLDNFWRLIFGLVLSSYLVFSAAAFGNASSAIHPDCYRYISAPHEPAAFSPIRLASEAAARAEYGNQGRPEFIDLKEELERERFRSGLPLPQAMARFFPPSLSAISHNLLNADEPPVVRFSKPSNNFYLRYEGNFRGQPIGTNLMTGVNSLRQRLIDPPENQVKYLIDTSASALVFWVHGGGTPTANASTAASLIDHFNKTTIQVLSTDMPLHGEGPTFPFASEEEVFEYLLGLINELVHPDVPVIFAGHSMGGQYSTMLHKFSHRPEVRSRIIGFIPLSAVADPAPGHSHADKKRVENEVESKKDYRKEAMAPADWVFIENILRNGKNAPTALLHTSLMKLFLDWSAPSPEVRDELLPMLLIIGARDGLTYVGYEKQFDEYIASLGPRAKLHLIEDRVNIHGNLEAVGHGIFDHYLPGTKDVFETYHLMLEFISQILAARGIDFELYKKYSSADEQNAATATHWIKSWVHDLGFREFAKRYQFVIKRNHPHLNSANERRKEAMQLKQQLSSAVQRSIPGTNRSARNKSRAQIFTQEFFEFLNREAPSLFASQNEFNQLVGKDFHDQILSNTLPDSFWAALPIDLAEKVKNVIDAEIDLFQTQFSLMVSESPDQLPLGVESFADFQSLIIDQLRYLHSVQGKYIPSYLNADKRAEVQAVVDKKTELELSRARISHAVQAKMKEYKALKNQREAYLRQITPMLKAATSAEFEAALMHSETILEELQLVASDLSEKQFTFLLDLYDQNRLNAENVFNLPDDFKPLETRYRHLRDQYQEALVAVVELQKQQAMAGLLTIDPTIAAEKKWTNQKMQELAIQLWDESEPSDPSAAMTLINQLKLAVVEIGNLTSSLVETDQAIGQVLIEYDRLVPGVFIVESHNLFDFLNRSDEPDFFQVYQDELMKGPMHLWEILVEARPPIDREDLHRTLPFEDD